MKYTRISFLASVVLLFLVFGCKQNNEVRSSEDTKALAPVSVSIPAVNADSAYQFVYDQVAMGPRVPGSAAHEECKNWLIQKLESYDWDVKTQEFEATTYVDFTYTATNIFASYKPDLKKRILLGAHWDTRFLADQDEDAEKHNVPILGADDGGSGVGLLLEIARVISENDLDLGVDILLFDAEDQGDSENNTPDSYCLGSQYWSKNKPADYQPIYGILLDMVGSQGARFPKEEVSMYFAGNIMNKIWKLAQSMGYGHLFVDEIGGSVMDDHYYVNRDAGIPMIDIINRPAKGEFGHYWHTHKDNMDVIDKNTLRSVGQVVIATLYKESIGAI